MSSKLDILAQTSSSSADQVISSLIKLKTPLAQRFLKRQSGMLPDSAHPLVLSLAATGVALLLFRDGLGRPAPGTGSTDTLTMAAVLTASQQQQATGILATVLARSKQMKQTVDALTDLLHTRNDLDIKEEKHMERAKQLLTGASQVSSTTLQACGPLLQLAYCMDVAALSKGVRQQVKQDPHILDAGDLDLLVSRLLLKGRGVPKRTPTLKALFTPPASLSRQRISGGHAAEERDVSADAAAAMHGAAQAVMLEQHGLLTPASLPRATTVHQQGAQPTNDARPTDHSETQRSSGDDGTFDWTIDILGAYSSPGRSRSGSLVSTHAMATPVCSPSSNRTSVHASGGAQAIATGLTAPLRVATLKIKDTPTEASPQSTGSIGTDTEQDWPIQTAKEVPVVRPGIKQQASSNQSTQLPLEKQDTAARHATKDPVRRLLQFRSSSQTKGGGDSGAVRVESVKGKSEPRPGQLKTARSMPIETLSSHGERQRPVQQQQQQQQHHQRSQTQRATKRPTTASKGRTGGAAQTTDMTIRDMYY